MTLRVVELFAGVGGFRIGLEGLPGSPRDGAFKVIWANQWEPSTKKQHAAEVYTARWGLESDPVRMNWFCHPEIEDDVFVNDDIANIPAKNIPDHDLLVGGFPCQDYSVAKTLDKAKGLQGKKGVLWWEIHRIIKAKKPKHVLLENVDRLLKSPKGQRGRDFAVMLASLDDLDYMIEWRMVDASEYGFPQRRKRVFILAHGPGTPGHSALNEGLEARDWMESEGVLAKALPIHSLSVLYLPSFNLRRSPNDDLADISNSFNLNSKDRESLFSLGGIMMNGTVWTCRPKAREPVEKKTLGGVLLPANRISDEFILSPESLTRQKGWIYFKGAKREMRSGSDGFTYRYSEGPITFPDALDRASRTIVTGEGGSGPSRFKHVVKFRPTMNQVESLDLQSKEAISARHQMSLRTTEWLRRLTPVELERLNGFPGDHTDGVTDGKRAFFMGNALVCGIVRRIGEALSERVTSQAP